MIDFLIQNAVFLIVVFGTLLIIIIAYLLYTRKTKNDSVTINEHTLTPAVDKTTELDMEQAIDQEGKEQSKEDPGFDENARVDEPVQRAPEMVFTLDPQTKPKEDSVERTPDMVFTLDSQTKMKEKSVEQEPDMEFTLDPQTKPKEEIIFTLDSQPIPKDETPLKEKTSAVSKETQIEDSDEDDTFESEEDSYDDEDGIEDFSGEPTSEKKELGKYHIIFRKSDKMWIIKREGSHKVIKALHTQNEAIAYATIKSIKQKSSYIIHKRDGKIRKQNY